MKRSGRIKFCGQSGLVIGLMLLWNLGWASSGFHLQDTTAQKIKNQVLQTQMKIEPVDSLTCDHTKPYFTNLRPYPNKKGVALFPTIKFTANDDDQHKDDDPSGIDTSAVFITVKVRPTSVRIIKARPHLVRFRDGFFKIDYDFTLPRQLNYDDTVWVVLEATDLSRNKNYGRKQYRLYIEKDPVPPELEVRQPIPFSTETLLATPLIFFAKDNKNMLNQNSAQLIINNQIIPWDKLQFISNGSGDTIKYQPDSPFDYNETVDVSFRIADIQENWADTTFWFDTIKDTTAPQIAPVRPLPDQTETSLNTDIVIFCSDDVSGVDTSSIVFKINDVAISPRDYSIIHVAGGDSIKYQPSVYQWNDTVNVSFGITDFAHNAADTAYQFFIKSDHIKPTIEVLQPFANENCVDDSTWIKFYVSDDKSGIDQNSANLVVNGKSVPSSELIFSSDASGDTVKYFPTVPFGYGENVDVNFSIADIVGNSADTSYSFIIETIPEIKIVRPQPNAVNVPISTDIAFYVPQTHCGIDSSTVIFVVNGDTIDHAALDFFNDGQGDSIKYQSATPFAWGSVDSVYFRIGDLVGNFAETSYSFTIENEPFPPEIEIVSPLPDANCVDGSASIVIVAIDSLSGIDINTADLKINLQSIPLSDLIFKSFNKGDTIIYEPKTPFTNGETINVNFLISDIAGNSADTSYSFIIETTPEIQANHPQPGEIGVSPTTDIVLYVPETLCKIDTNSVSLSVNDTARTSMNISFDGTGYEFQFIPTAPFHYNDTVNVYFSISDMASNQADTSYHFVVASPPDTIPPIIEIINPVPAEHCVDDSAEIVLFAKDLETGVAVSTIELVLNGSVIDTSDIIATPNTQGIGDTLRFHPLVPFGMGDSISVYFAVSDFAGNKADTSYSFFIETAPEIRVVRPLPGDTTVAPTTDIVVYVPETFCKIDTNSYVFTVNNAQQGNVNISFDGLGYEFQFVAADTFSSGDSVNVYFGIVDSAGNWADTSYYFKIRSEIILPKIAIIRPLPNATNVDDLTDVKFYVFDFESGIDTTFLALKVDSVLIEHSKLAFNKTPAGFFVTYNPSQPFQYGDTVPVDIFVKDKAGNKADSSYSFTVEPPPETIPPRIVVYVPKPNATGVDPGTNIKIYTFDLETGIDSSTVQLSVDAAVIDHSEITFTKTSVGYFVDYQPASPFSYDSTVHVNFSVKDFARNVADTSYVFAVNSAPSPQPNDSIPPVIEVITPLPDDHCVNDSTEIILFVEDADTGVDLSTIELKINGNVIDNQDLIINTTTQGIGDTIRFPFVPFDMGDTISVHFSVSDFAPNISHTTYSFIIETMPEIQVLRPLPGDTTAAPTTDIAIYVPETLCKIDTSSYVFTVNNAQQGKVNISFDGQGYQFQFVPNIAFSFNETVNVHFGVADSASNWADTSYSFKIEKANTGKDTMSPIITLISPKPNEVVEDTTNIVIKVTDTSPGVDSSKVILKIDSNEINHSFITFSGDSAAYNIVYRPSAPFQQGSVVNVYFYAADFDSNPADTSYKFSIISVQEDTVLPKIFAIHPQPNETNVDDSTAIVLYVVDHETGVDLSTASMSVDSQKISNDSLQFIPNVFGIGDTVKYQPEYAFQAGAIITVSFSIKDFSNNLATKTYQFTVEIPPPQPDTIPPKIVIVGPKLNDRNVPTTTSINIKTWDEQTQVDKSKIKLIVLNSEVQYNNLVIEEIQDIALDTFSVKYVPQIALPSRQKITVRFHSEDVAGNAADSVYSFVTKGAKIIVRSNPFTPNGDGINDEVEFNFEKLDVADPVLKIFDLHNQIQKEIHRPGVRSIHWDGRDDRGKPLLPGIYFYILLDGNKPKTRGIVAIAK
ncbi:MAG: hypothetical protein GXO74_01140 [Calditrichaeota bacterium]|nr:hypothetical protein [Calditrichota bacterium]